MEFINVKPFVKWVGGKSQLLSEIRKTYPEKIDKYCEPFVGGGAVLFDILANFHPSEVLINDINAELINTYIQVKTNVDKLIAELSVIQASFLVKNNSERRLMFLDMRDRFNKLKSINKAYQIETAVLFIFLNKTCFNGLYRVNSEGRFNVPIGAYKNPTICDEKSLLTANILLQHVNITCGDYSKCIDFVDRNTFMYIDPPYYPLTSTSFISYSETEFYDQQQRELRKFVDDSTTKGAKVVVSNSDPRSNNKNNNFLDNLYSGYSISRVLARRSINCKKTGRGDINELLICNFRQED